MEDFVTLSEIEQMTITGGDVYQPQVPYGDTPPWNYDPVAPYGLIPPNDSAYLVVPVPLPIPIWV